MYLIVTMNISRFTPYKQFDPVAYAANDFLAKDNVSGWLVDAGWTVNQSGQFEVDFDTRRPDGSICRIEVDRRTTPRWKPGQSFPFATYELGARKRQLLTDSTVVFVTVNANGDRWIACGAATFLDSGDLVSKTLGGSVEEFMSVPVNLTWQGAISRPSASNPPPK